MRFLRAVAAIVIWSSCTIIGFSLQYAINPIAGIAIAVTASGLASYFILSELRLAHERQDAARKRTAGN
jgi:hypothetical protein